MPDRVLQGTNVPKAFTNTLLCDYDVHRRKGNQSLFRQIDSWDPTDSKPALLMQGAPGLGKTMLASALLNEYHGGLAEDAVDTYLLQEKLPIYFIQLAELISLHLRLFKLEKDIETGIREPTEYLDTDKFLEDLKHRVKVLVIDDVGKEHHGRTSYAEDEFDLLVRTRHNNGLTTIYTTNLPLRSWGSRYSDSMQSLITRSSCIVDF